MAGSLTEGDRQAVAAAASDLATAAASDLAAQALRVLALASKRVKGEQEDYSSEESNLIFIGLCGM